jgi:hypothetical protein
MTRRGGMVPGLRVRVTHEATRLSQAHVAAAFEQLVPVLERQISLPRAESDKHEAAAGHGSARPMTKPVATRYVTNSPLPRAGVRNR